MKLCIYLSVHSPDEPCELAQCLKHDDSTINIILLIIIIIIIFYYYKIHLYSALSQDATNALCNSWVVLKYSNGASVSFRNRVTLTFDVLTSVSMYA